MGDASTVLFVPTHILPNNHHRYEGEGSGTNPASSVLAMNQAYGSWAAQRSQPYAWFNDHCNQVCIFGVILASTTGPLGERRKKGPGIEYECSQLNSPTCNEVVLSVCNIEEPGYKAEV